MSRKRDEEAEGSGSRKTVLAWLTRTWRFELTCENLTWMAVAVGVILRVWEYLDFRALYMDEDALLKNIVGRAVFDFHHVLEDDQMAPPGFLTIERLLVRLPLDVRASGRLFPLCCGILTMFLMKDVARRYLDRRAVPVAVAFLALGDHLIYYSAEIKQYSCDLVFALFAFLLATPQPPERMSAGRFKMLAIFGLIAPWFSFPVVFVLAGVGLHLILTEAMRKDWRRVGAAMAMSVFWLASFLGCFLLSRSILSSRDFIWVWWNFAFIPLPPRSLAEVSSLGETVANVFINPGSLLSPLPLPYTAAAASVLALVGCLSLGRRWPGGLFIVLSPFFLALGASALRQYPFHGRLLLYLVPTYLMLLAEGTAAISRPTHWIVCLALAGFFLCGQAAELLWEKAIQQRSRTFDSHGDLKNDLLDYLEYKRFHHPPLPPERTQTR
jgi:hypothetical protein